MKKVVMNKNFINKYNNLFVNNIFDPTYLKQCVGIAVSIRTLASNLTTISYGKQDYIFVCNDTFLSVIDSINEFDFSTIEGAHKYSEEYITTYLSYGDDAAKTAVDTFLIDNGVITQEQYDNSQFSGLIMEYSESVTFIESVVNDCSITFKRNYPTTLRKPLLNGINGTPYLCFFPVTNQRFGNFNHANTSIIYDCQGTYAVVTDIINSLFQSFEKNDGSEKLVVPYMAFKLSETDGDGDIKYDHLDKITHLDNIKFTISLPKEIVLQY